MKSMLKFSALMSAVVLAGCVTQPQEPAAPAQQGAVQVQVECGVASPPGCREPAVFVEWDRKVQGEIATANELRQRAVDAMATLPAKQRIGHSETTTTEQAFRFKRGNFTRNIKVLDTVVLDLPWAAKSTQEHKDAMTAVKDIATLMADNRGGATIYVTVSPRDLRAKKVNLKSGSAPTEAGNPVEVKKSADKDVPPGIEHFVIQAKPWGNTID